MSKVYLYTARATTAEKVQFGKKDTSVGLSYLYDNASEPFSFHGDVEEEPWVVCVGQGWWDLLRLLHHGLHLLVLLGVGRCLAQGRRMVHVGRVRGRGLHHRAARGSSSHHRASHSHRWRHLQVIEDKVRGKLCYN